MVSKSILDKKLFLLDAYALIYRAYYALIKTPRYTSKGLNTSAILGFTNTLMEILEKEKPTHIAVVFDPSGKTFRHEMFPTYKGQRPPTPEDIKLSIPHIKNLLKCLNISDLCVDGFEADDLVGTLAKKAEKEGYTVYMMTPDKDYAQLVSDNIFMYKPKKAGKDVEIMGVPEVLASFGIERVDQVIDILGLMGDAADNVPGCPGVGPKSANILISKYGNIEGIYEHISELKGKQKENLENFKDQVELSRELVIINTQVPNDTEIANLKVKDINRDSLSELLTDLEFHMLAERILGSYTKKEELKSLETLEHQFFDMSDESLHADLRADLCIQDEFSFCTELTSEDPHNAKPLSITFALKNNKSFYLKFPHTDEGIKTLLKSLKPILEDAGIGKISSDLKREILWMKWYGISLAGKFFDVKIAHYILKPDGDHKLASLASDMLSYAMIAEEKKKKNVQLALFAEEEEKDENFERLCEKALVYFKLKSELHKELKEVGTYKIFEDIEMPLINVLADMEFAGTNVSTKSLADFSVYLKEKIGIITKTIHELAGEVFNIASPKILGEILFDKLKLDEKAKRTKTGQYSTGEPVLTKLKDKHEIIAEILSFRSLTKLLNTYAAPLHTFINPKSGKIHTSYNQAEAATGRLSSEKPNLQNIPIRTEEGKKIRKAFIASDENHILIAADYSQIELRLMAHLSGDKAMVEAFKNNEDIHTATAAKINKIKLEDVDTEMRRRAKSANFGIIYGVSAWGLASNLDIPRKEGKALIDGYFETYPGVKEFMDNCIVKAREIEYVETIMGRRRYLKDINSRNGIVRGIAERNAINAPLQGSAADIIKIAMINVYNRMNMEGLKSKMILQVHDELIFDCLLEEKDKLKTILFEEMQEVVKLDVPLTIELGEADNWLDAH
jgi:DNA polymerase-1